MQSYPLGLLFTMRGVSSTCTKLDLEGDKSLQGSRILTKVEGESAIILECGETNDGDESPRCGHSY